MSLLEGLMSERREGGSFDKLKGLKCTLTPENFELEVVTVTI